MFLILFYFSRIEGETKGKIQYGEYRRFTASSKKKPSAMWKTTKTLSDVYYMHIPTQTSLLDIFGNTCERCQGSAVVRRIASRRVAVVFPLTSPSTCLLHYLAPTHPAPYTSNEMTSRNVALEVLAQYFWRMKCGISNNAALWWKKLAARWGDRSRNVENLFHAADMLENLAF